MCGRYAASQSTAELALEFEVDQDRTGEPSRSVLVNPQQPPAGSADYNMAPTKQARVVLSSRPRPPHGSVDTGGTAAAAPSAPSAPSAPPASPAESVRQLRLLTWGLVPSWSKTPSTGLRMINARAETVLGKGAFARAVLRRRCLVPADGWFEWQVSPTARDAKGRPRKQPFFIHRGDGDPIAFGGLFEHWRDPAVEDSDDPRAWLSTFTILTTVAEPGLDRIHDRQPLVLDPDQWSAWLDPDLQDPDAVASLLLPAAPGRFVGHPVRAAVGAAASNGPQLLDPLPPDQLHGVVDPMSGEVLGE